MPEIIGEYVDRLVNIEMHGQGGVTSRGVVLSRGVIHRFYEAARKKQGLPLTYLAAKGLVERLKPGDRVILATGAGVPPYLPKGETDGPLGAASIARALDIGLGVKPIITGEERTLGPSIATLEAAEITVGDERLFNEREHIALAVPYPLGEKAGQAAAIEILDKYKPKAIVCVEKHGPSASGVYHGRLGLGRSPDLVSNVRFLTDLAMERGIFTIGIGDGGNEIGFGLIHEEVKQIQNYGGKCQCPCGAGIATVSKADVLVPAAISNWGAYGVSAMLAFLLKNREVLHDKNIEYRMLDACVRAGSMDALFSRQRMSVDGNSLDSQIAMITLLNEIVVSGLSEQPAEWQGTTLR